MLISCSILGGISMHFRDSWDHFGDFLGVFLGAYFLGLSKEAPGAIRSARERFSACPGEGFREGKPLPKGTLGRRGLKELGWGI